MQSFSFMATPSTPGLRPPRHLTSTPSPILPLRIKGRINSNRANTADRAPQKKKKRSVGWGGPRIRPPISIGCSRRAHLPSLLPPWYACACVSSSWRIEQAQLHARRSGRVERRAQHPGAGLPSAGPALRRGGAVHTGIGSDLRARQQDGRGILPRK